MGHISARDLKWRQEGLQLASASMNNAKWRQVTTALLRVQHARCVMSTVLLTCHARRATRKSEMHISARDQKWRQEGLQLASASMNNAKWRHQNVRTHPVTLMCKDINAKLTSDTIVNNWNSSATVLKMQKTLFQIASCRVVCAPRTTRMKMIARSAWKRC